ncbi:hypothetical protein ACFX15_046249 [Malus domestica]
MIYDEWAVSFSSLVSTAARPAATLLCNHYTRASSSRVPGGLPKPVSRSPDGPGTTLVFKFVCKDKDWYGKISRTRCSVARFLFAEALLAHLVPPDNLESRLQKHRDCVFPFH